MFTLEATLLGTFGGAEGPIFNQIMLFLSGLAVIGFAITMGLIMIIKGTKKLKKHKEV